MCELCKQQALTSVFDVFTAKVLSNSKAVVKKVPTDLNHSVKRVFLRLFKEQPLGKPDGHDPGVSDDSDGKSTSGESSDDEDSRKADMPATKKHKPSDEQEQVRHVCSVQ